MPTANRPSSYLILGGSYYYPGEDFATWRVQFEALCERQQWPDSIAKQYPYAYMQESAGEAVMDIISYGPESLTQMLNAFETRFQLLEDLVRLRLRREGLIHGSRRRCQPGRRRKSLLKPRARRGIMAPTPRPPPEWNTGRVIQIENPGGQLEEVTLPPRVEDLQRRTLVERTRALLRESEDGTTAPSTEDIRNRLRRSRGTPTYQHREKRLPVPGQAQAGNLGANRIFRQDSSR